MTSLLEGIRVIDLTRYIAGPYCIAIMGDMGAEVIEIERPSGDDGRRRGILYNGENIKWHVYHRNKKVITLNLRADEGKEILHDLVRRADVVVENYRVPSTSAPTARENSTRPARTEGYPGDMGSDDEPVVGVVEHGRDDRLELFQPTSPPKAPHGGQACPCRTRLPGVAPHRGYH